jgi:hypothetical protein
MSSVRAIIIEVYGEAPVTDIRNRTKVRDGYSVWWSLPKKKSRISTDFGSDIEDVEFIW